MKQADIKKGCNYSNGKATRFVLKIEHHSEPHHPSQVLYLSVEGSDPTFPNWCDLKTFAQWAKKRVVPVWVAARPCPDCESWCTETVTAELTVDLECPNCGYFLEGE